MPEATLPGDEVKRTSLHPREISNETGPLPNTDYVAFIDESGDAVLDPIDPQFPVMVLAICIFHRAAYETDVIPRFQTLKRRYFGREDVVFHERDIRQRRGMFTSIGGEHRREQLMLDLTQALEVSPFTVVAVAARKQESRPARAPELDLYQRCLRSGLFRVFEFLAQETSDPLPIDVIAESRGRREDRHLKDVLDAFQRPASAEDPSSAPGFDLSFANKAAGHIGLEIADLIAYPIARHVLGRPQRRNPFGLIEQKMHRGPDGRVDGHGLTVIDA